MKKCILTVASSMTDETYSLLCERVKERLGDEACPVRKNDDSVIAGFIMEYEGEVTDLSVGTQLKLLKAQLAKREG